jgi:GTP-binding protein
VPVEIIKDSVNFQLAIAEPEQLDAWLAQSTIPSIAFVGRSNVGKSSLINSLFGKKTARSSKTPGRTREIVIFQFKIAYTSPDGSEKKNFDYILYDLPGYGHAQVSKEMGERWQILIDNFFRNVQRGLIVCLQDARHPNQSVDQTFADYLKQFRQDTFLVFNKIDKIKTQKEKSEFQKYLTTNYKSFKWAKQVYQVSAESKKGIPELSTSIISELLKHNLRDQMT